MEPIVCSDTSVRNYHYTLRNSPEDRGFHLLRGRSFDISHSLMLSENMTVSVPCHHVYQTIFTHLHCIPEWPWPLRCHQSQSNMTEQVSVIEWAYFATAQSMVLCSVNNWLWPSRDHNDTRSNHVSATDSYSRRSELQPQTLLPYTQSIKTYCEFYNTEGFRRSTNMSTSLALSTSLRWTK